MGYAGGYIGDAVNNGETHYYTGWACNPGAPFEGASVHVWAADTFLGAIPVNVQREDAVGAQCGGNSVRGFAGYVNIPAHLRNWKSRDVWVVYVGSQNVNLTNSPMQVYFGSGPAPQPRTLAVNNCGQGNPGPDWILTKRSGSTLCSREWIDEDTVKVTHGYNDIYTYILDMPLYYETLSCKNPYPDHMNFSVITTVPNHVDCQKFYGNGGATTYTTGYIIRRVQ